MNHDPASASFLAMSSSGARPIASGELGTLDVTAISAESWWAFLYLIVFGAPIGCAAYT